jgi:hypothetical protein
VRAHEGVGGPREDQDPEQRAAIGGEVFEERFRSRIVRWVPVLALVVAIGLAQGCVLSGAPTEATPLPSTPMPAITVAPPADGGGFATCPPRSSVPEAVAFRAEAVADAGGRAPGWHRLDATSFLFVWASYDATLRQDRVARIGEVQVARDGADVHHVCVRIDVAAPQTVDGRARTYDVAVGLNATAGLPPGPLRLVANWAAGCACEPIPMGNATLDVPT